MKINKLINTFNYYKCYIKYYSKFMFLHKPLCDKYKNDSILVLNKFYLCRSCLFLYIGFILSIFLSLCLPTPDIKYIFIYAIIISIFSFPKIYRYYTRLLRDFIRFNTGFMCGILFVATFKISVLAFAATFSILVIIKYLYNQMRKTTDICKNCKELTYGGTCSGYKLQQQALLDMEENYCKLLNINEGELL